MKKLLLVLGVTGGLLAVGAGLFVWLFDFDEALNAQKDEHLPRVEALLGRKVTVGAIKTTFLPVLGATIEDVVVLGRTPDEAPLLKLDRLVFRVDLWTAVKSAGTDVKLEALLLEGLAVNLVREADGSLSYDDVLKRLAEGPPPEEAPKPLDPEARKFIENLQLQRIALVDGRFDLVDKATGGAPATTQIKKLNVELNDVVLSSPFDLRVRAAVFADAENFDLTVRVGPVPIGKPDAVLPIHKVKIEAKSIDLARIIPYLGEGFPLHLDSAAFSANLTIDDPTGAKGPIAVAGSLGLTKLALVGGEAFDIEAKPNLTFDPAAGALDLTGFSLDFAGMTVTASGKVDGLKTARPAFHGLKVATTGIDLGRLQTLLPPLAAALPKGMKLAGPLVFDVNATGDASAQTIAAVVDLDGARIFVPGALDKPAGTALHVRLDADTTPQAVTLKGMNLAVGGLNLTLTGSVSGLDTKPSFDLRGDTGSFPLGGLMRLLPAVNQAVPADVQIAGNLQLSALIEGDGQYLDAKVKVAISGADLEVPGVTVRGSGRIDASAVGNPSKSLVAKVDADLDGLEVKAGADFHKPAGTALSLHLDATSAGAATTVRSLTARIGPLDLQASGSANAGNLDLRMTIQRFAVAGLTGLVPALKDGPLARATLGASVALKGNPSRPTTVEAQLDDFYFGVGRSSLAGKASVKNLDAPIVRFTFNSPHFDLDEVFPPAPGPAPPEPEGGGGPLPPIVQRIDAQGALRIADGKAVDIPFTDFVGELTMKSGVLRFSSLQFKAYDGTFSAAPTTVDLSGAKPAFDLNVKMDRVDANKLLTEQANQPNVLKGRMSTELQVKGKGEVWEELAPTLSGALGLALAEGELPGLNLESDLLGGVAKKIPQLKLPKAGGTALKALAARFEIRNGRLELKEPLKTNTGSGPLTLDGAIGLDTSLHLTGTMELQPETLRRLSGGKVNPDKPIPVSLTIGGTLADPKVSGVDAEKLAVILVAAALGGLAGDQIEAAKKAAEEARRRAEAEARKLTDMARRKADEVKRKAQQAKTQALAAANKAKNDAQRKAKAAADKAKKDAAARAKKKLKGLF